MNEHLWNSSAKCLKNALLQKNNDDNVSNKYSFFLA